MVMDFFYLAFKIFIFSLVCIIIHTWYKMKKTKKLNNVFLVVSMLKNLDLQNLISSNLNSTCTSLQNYYLYNTEIYLKELSNNISDSKNQLGHILYEILLKVLYEFLGRDSKFKPFTFYSRDTFNECLNLYPIISHYFLIFNSYSTMSGESGDFFASCLVKFEEENTIQKTIEKFYKSIDSKCKLNLSFGQGGLTFGKYLVVIFKNHASISLINQKEIIVFNTHFSMLYFGISNFEGSLILTADTRQFPKKNYYLSFLIYKNLNI